MDTAQFVNTPLPAQRSALNGLPLARVVFHHILDVYTQCELLSNLKFDWDSGLFFAFRAPGPAGVGAVPRGTGSHYARLGVSGRAEARPHARGTRLDVHTELFVYVGAPLEPDLGGGLEPPLCLLYFYL